MQGFRCPASRHECKYCKKIGHFSHTCFKKPQEQIHKKGPHKPQAHQLQVGRYSSGNQQYDQEDTSESEDSFYLQMQIKPEQADHESCETQHLFTHLEYKLKYHRRSTKFLRARIDTCSNANVMPVSIYKKIFKDPDCSKLTQNQSEGIYTYTTEKIPVIGSCELLVLHPDDKCFLKVPLHVVSIKGSVIVSCATSINLNLIQIHKELDTNIPDCARWYYSSADKPRANQEQWEKVDHTAKYDKNCQDPNLRAQMPAKTHNWKMTYSKQNKPYIPIRNQEDDKNCQYKYVKGIRCTDLKHQMTRETVMYEKNCQETNMQTVHSISQKYRRLCQDQTCQSTRCSKKISDSHKRQKIQNDQLPEPNRYKSGCDQYNLSPRWYKF